MSTSIATETRGRSTVWTTSSSPWKCTLCTTTLSTLTALLPWRRATATLWLVCWAVVYLHGHFYALTLPKRTGGVRKID